MLCLVVAVLGTIAFAEQEVYKITTSNDAAGFYVQIDEQSKTFQKLGGPTDSDYFVYLYYLPKYPGSWNIGVKKNEENVKRSLISASVRKYRPPRKGWKSTKTEKAVALEVTKKPSLVFTLKETEANEGSATVDGGVICLKQNSDKWILLKRYDSERCDDNRDCKNGMDVLERGNCPRKPSKTPTTSTTTISTTIETETKTESIRITIPTQDPTLSTTDKITDDVSDSTATESNPNNIVTEEGIRFPPHHTIHPDLGI